MKKINEFDANKSEPQAMAGEPQIVLTLNDQELITLQSHREAMAAIEQDRDEWKDATISANTRFKMAEEKLRERDEAIEKKDAALMALLPVAIRYRNETPLGHQPHMIAHVADAAIQQAQEALK